MKLKDWLEKEKITQNKIAEDLKLSQACIAYYVLAQKIPRAENMQKIIAYTKGEVTANDFYGVEE